MAHLPSTSNSYISKQFSFWSLFRRETNEVHIVLDHPDHLSFNPEHKVAHRRHSHITDLAHNSQILKPWQDYIECKYCIVKAEAFGSVFLRSATGQLTRPCHLAGHPTRPCQRVLYSWAWRWCMGTSHEWHSEQCPMVWHEDSVSCQWGRTQGRSHKKLSGQVSYIVLLYDDMSKKSLATCFKSKLSVWYWRIKRWFRHGLAETSYVFRYKIH